MATSGGSPDSVSEVKHAQTQDVLQDHEERITTNERFRLRMQGAMAIVGFSLGGGAVMTVLLFLIGTV